MHHHEAIGSRADASSTSVVANVRAETNRKQRMSLGTFVSLTLHSLGIIFGDM
jgi:hypothetical protein